MPRILAVLIITAALLTACDGGRPTRAATEAPQAAPTATAIPQRTAAAPTGNQAAGAHRQVRCDSCMMKMLFAQ